MNAKLKATFTPYFLPLFILSLFFVASVFLTIRQELLLEGAQEAFVSAEYVDLQDPANHSFTITHQASTARTVTLEYHYPNQETATETLTLAPHEQKTLTPSRPPLSLTLRYQDHAHQEQSLTLYKK